MPVTSHVKGRDYRGSYDATELIGFTRIGVRRECWNWDDDSDVQSYSAVDADWRFRMKSLRAIAQELAIAPELDPEEEAIVGLIASIGHRLTTTQILSEFERRGLPKGESTVKGKLAQLTRRKVLVNRSDTNPKGYGLPEWA